jgi:transposase-like protein
LYAAGEPETKVILHDRLFPTRTTVTTRMFLKELAEKHEADEAEFLVDGAPWLQAGLCELGRHFRHETFGELNPVERGFQEKNGEYDICTICLVTSN